VDNRKRTLSVAVSRIQIHTFHEGVIIRLDREKTSSAKLHNEASKEVLHQFLYVQFVEQKATIIVQSPKEGKQNLSKPEIKVIMQTWHKHNVPAHEAIEQEEEISTLPTNTEVQQTH